MVVQYKRRHWSIDRPITDDRIERQLTERTGKQRKKKEQHRSNPPKSMPQAKSHSTWVLATQAGYQWQLPIAGEYMLHTRLQIPEDMNADCHV